MILFLVFVLLAIGVFGPIFFLVHLMEKYYQEGLDIAEGIREDQRKWDADSKKYWADWAERNKK